MIREQGKINDVVLTREGVVRTMPDGTKVCSPFINPKEAAAHLNMSLPELRARSATGEIPGHRL